MGRAGEGRWGGRGEWIEEVHGVRARGLEERGAHGESGGAGTAR